MEYLENGGEGNSRMEFGALHLVVHYTAAEDERFHHADSPEQLFYLFPPTHTTAS